MLQSSMGRRIWWLQNLQWVSLGLWIHRNPAGLLSEPLGYPESLADWDASLTPDYCLSLAMPKGMCTQGISSEIPSR